MSFRIGGGGDDRPEEMFESTGAGSGGESDADDHVHSLIASQPLRRMNSDSIYDMASMTGQLPAKKKGLSRYYEGRSQSFACMTEVRCLEDLRKKVVDNPYNNRKKVKSSAALRRGTANPSSESCANLNVVVAADGFMAPQIHVNKN